MSLEVLGAGGVHDAHVVVLVGLPSGANCGALVALGDPCEDQSHDAAPTVHSIGSPRCLPWERGSFVA